MTLEKRRLRDLQMVDQLGATLVAGTYCIDGVPVPWQPYEWLLTAGYLARDGVQLVLTERGERAVAEPAEREWVVSVRVVSPVTDVYRLPTKARGDVYAYEQATGKVKADPFGDDELFLEDVARLAAVRKTVDHDRIWLEQNGTITNFATGEQYSGDPERLFRWGPLSRNDEMLRPLAVENLATNYHRLPIFHRNAGRKVALADGTLESLEAAIAEVAPESGQVVVKVNRRKYGIETIDIRGGITNAIFQSEGLPGTLMHLEDVPEAFLVQEHVEMTFERRYFVVDGIAVTSAGCIEEYTPYDNLGMQHDPRARMHRGRRDITWAVEETEKLTAFVHDITRELRRSETWKKMTEYVLDVALGPDGEPLIVEFNAIRNSGLYACQPQLITRMLARRDDVWGQAPHARPRATVDTGTGE